MQESTNLEENTRSPRCLRWKRSFKWTNPKQRKKQMKMQLHQKIEMTNGTWQNLFVEDGLENSLSDQKGEVCSWIVFDKKKLQYCQEFVLSLWKLFVFSWDFFFKHLAIDRAPKNWNSTYVRKQKICSWIVFGWKQKLCKVLSIQTYKIL
jgi:hypothetical protein